MVTFVKKYPFLLFGMTVVVFYFIGFLFGENSSGGSRGDFYTFHYPAVLHFASLPLTEAMIDYPSASTPLFYILNVYINPFINNEIAYRLTNILLSFVIIALFISALKERYSSISKSTTLFFSAVLVVSPYFKSSAIWAGNDNLPYLFLILSIIFLYRFLKERSYTYATAVLFFSASAAMTRQYFVVFVIYFLYRLIKWDESSKKENIALIILTLIISIPLLYLVSLWGGLNPPSFQHHSHFDLNSIPYLFSYITFYALPYILFLLYALFKNKNKSDQQVSIKLVKYVILGVLYCIVFYSFSFYEIGGGFLVKIVQIIDNTFQSHIAEILFVFISLIGFLFSIYLFSISKNNMIIILSLSFLIMTHIIFHRYADPMLNIILLLLIDFGKKGEMLFNTKTFAISLLVYNLSFYLIAMIYYNFIFWE